MWTAHGMEGGKYLEDDEKKNCVGMYSGCQKSCWFFQCLQAPPTPSLPHPLAPPPLPHLSFKNKSKVDFWWHRTLTNSCLTDHNDSLTVLYEHISGCLIIPKQSPHSDVFPALMGLLYEDALERIQTHPTITRRQHWCQSIGPGVNLSCLATLMMRGEFCVTNPTLCCYLPG